MKLGDSYICSRECSLAIKYMAPGMYEIYYKGADISAMRSLILDYVVSGNQNARDRLRKLLSLA
jgi:hypothetical protein